MAGVRIDNGRTISDYGSVGGGGGVTRRPKTKIADQIPRDESPYRWWYLSGHNISTTTSVLYNIVAACGRARYPKRDIYYTRLRYFVPFGTAAVSETTISDALEPDSRDRVKVTFTRLRVSPARALAEPTGATTVQ